MNLIELLEEYCKKFCEEAGDCDNPLCNVALAIAELRKPCEWKKTGMNRWHTSCGHIPLLMSMEDLEFCPYKGCGKRIKEIR